MLSIFHSIRVFLISLLALVAGIVGLVGIDLAPASAQGGIAAPDVCAVTNADAGAFVFWSAVPNVGEYVYGTRYNNGPERFDRTGESSLFIPSDQGRVTALRVAAVVGGATSNSTICTVDGAGGPPATQPPATQPPTDGGCNVAAEATGVSATWHPVDGAVEYVYALRYSGALRYDRVGNASTVIAVPPNMDVSLAVSAVFADGTYSPAVDCGTARTYDGSTGDCKSEALDGAILVSYPAVDEAVSYVFALKVNSGSVYYDRVAFTSLKLDIGSGTTGSVRISAVFADGSYSAATTCASVTAR